MQGPGGLIMVNIYSGPGDYWGHRGEGPGNPPKFTSPTIWQFVFDRARLTYMYRCCCWSFFFLFSFRRTNGSLELSRLTQLILCASSSTKGAIRGVNIVSGTCTRIDKSLGAVKRQRTRTMPGFSWHRNCGLFPGWRCSGGLLTQHLDLDLTGCDSAGNTHCGCSELRKCISSSGLVEEPCCLLPCTTTRGRPKKRKPRPASTIIHPQSLTHSLTRYSVPPEPNNLNMQRAVTHVERSN